MKLSVPGKARYFFLLLILLVLVTISFKKPQPVLANKRIVHIENLDLQGHRGSRGLRPENTWPAFSRAIELGMTTIELDLNITADNQLIIYHDFRLSKRLCRNPAGKRIRSIPIKKLTVAKLKTLDCGLAQRKIFPHQLPVEGEKLITLEEFFLLVKEHEKKNPGARKIRFNLEIKLKDRGFTQQDTEKIAQLLYEQMKKFDVIERSMVQSFYLPVLQKIKELDSSIQTGTLYATKHHRKYLKNDLFRELNSKLIGQTIASGSKTLGVQKHLLSQSLIEEAHARSLNVYVWTVNDPYEIFHFLSMGVDGIITDYPDRLSLTWKMFNEVSGLKTRLVAQQNELHIPRHLVGDQLVANQASRNLFLHIVSSVFNKPVENLKIVP